MCHLPYNCHLHSQWARLRHTKVACHIHVSFAPALTETRRSGSLFFYFISQQQPCQFAGLVFYWPWITHSTARWGWRASDGSGYGVANPMWTQRPGEKLEHRNRQLLALIVCIEMDVLAEWNQWTVDKFEHFSRWKDHDSNCKKQSKCKVQSNGKMQREILWTDWRQVWSWRQL